MISIQGVFRLSLSLLPAATLCLCIAVATADADLVGYWNFEGDVLDHSGTNNNGTLVGATYSTDVPGVIGPGQSLDFAVDANHVAIAANTSLDSSVFTWSMFLNDRGQPGKGYERTTGRTGNAFETAIGTAGLSFYAPSMSWQSTAGLPANTWKHVAYVSTGASVSTYVDGVLVHGPVAGTPTPSGVLHIGNNLGNNEGFNGLIDDVALWNEPLPVDALQRLAAGDATPFNALINPDLTTIGSDTSWQLSTVSSDGGPSGPWANPLDVTLPASGTFTLPVISTAGAVSHLDAAIGALGVAGMAAENNIRFYRKTFELGDVLGDTSATVSLAVDNGASLYINGQWIASETSYDAANWNNFPYSKVEIGTDGTVAVPPGSLMDQTAATFDGWVPGTNEIVLAVRNPNSEAGVAGGIAFKMDLLALATKTVHVGTSTTDWFKSTVVLPDTPAGDPGEGDVSQPLTPPGTETYVTPAVATGAGELPHFGGVPASLGVEALISGNDIHFFRTTFELEAWDEISAEMELAVDNGAQVFINGQLVATETSFLVENWAFPLPGLSIATDGSVTPNKFESAVANFTGWLVGENELVVAVRNPDAAYVEPVPPGGFALGMDITTTPVPEPAGLPLALAGGLGLLIVRRRR